MTGKDIQFKFKVLSNFFPSLALHVLMKPPCTFVVFYFVINKYMNINFPQFYLKCDATATLVRLYFGSLSYKRPISTLANCGKYTDAAASMRRHFYSV